MYGYILNDNLNKFCNLNIIISIKSHGKNKVSNIVVYRR